MALKRVPLLSGAYHNSSLIADAQRCVNVFPEKTFDPQSPVPVIHIQTPGSALYANADLASKVRCTYRTSIGTTYVVIGTNVYLLATNRALVQIGTVTDRPSQIIMADNGLVIVLVDGVSGWAIDMATNDFGIIIDASFYGADYVIFLDTFFAFNRPNTDQFYISLSMVDFALLTAGIAFDPLDIAAKAGNADPIVALAAVHRELWLIGELTTEVWAGSGAADFYFQLQQGAFIDHGCIAQFSVACMDTFSFWLMQDKQGKCIVVQAGGYQVKGISKPGLVAAFQKFTNVTDAIGGCFQILDHAFYVLAFPTDNVTYVYDITTGEWHQWAWVDANGVLNRHRFNCCMFGQGYNLIGDWETGKIWYLDPTIFVDGDPDDMETERPITRIRTYPHMLKDGARVIYNHLIIDMECGTIENDGDEDIDVDNPVPNPALVSMRWSDDRGKSFGNPLIQSAGVEGDYLKQISYWRLGQARDRVFEISWSSGFKTSLNGAFVETTPCQT